MARPVRELEHQDPDGFLTAHPPEDGPVLLRGAARSWPLVLAARQGPAAVRSCLLDHYEGAPVTAFRGEPGIAGRIFYTEGLERTNFEQTRTTLDRVLAELAAVADDPEPPTVYMGSMALDQCLPGFRGENSLPLAGRQATVRIWIGNRTLVSAHYDVMDNVAVVCAGQRRFTLFPPDQLANLYVGPVDFTPAGQAISLVDPRAPDLDRFPRYAEAQAHAQIADMEPGDALFIPAMWWHQVEALTPFNVLINHWWRDAPAHAGPPLDVLLHAMLGLRDLPKHERRAWRDLFDHYIFDFDEDRVAHIPAGRRGVLGPLSDEDARRLRAALRNRLNR